MGTPHGGAAPTEEVGGGAQRNDTVQRGSRQRQGSAENITNNSRGSLTKDHRESDDHGPSGHSHEGSSALVISKAQQSQEESIASAEEGVDGPGATDDVVAGGGVGGDQYWLRTTDILRDIVDGCLATATADVKSNLIKAMNNLMVSNERRAALVAGHEISSLFELVHGYTPEVIQYIHTGGTLCTAVYTRPFRSLAG